MDEGVKGIKIPHRILDLVQLLPFVILIILYRYPLPYEVNSTVFASKSYKTLEAPRYIMSEFGGQPTVSYQRALQADGSKTSPWTGTALISARRATRLPVSAFWL
jgi:hypothetical protein